MGVSNLWKLLDSGSTSVLLSSLSGKRVAVDASIWLYQFMMAMRDTSTGNAIQGAHLIGFLSRILKLLFHGIYPIFVYDGAVPVLKKLTIQKRRDRRNLKKSRVEEMAKKLLEKRMKLFALEGSWEKSADIPADCKDEYELPPSKRIKADTIQDADIRMPADQELFDFIQEHKQEIDLNKVDIDSEKFKALSLEKQHEIILSLKNKSRLPSLERVQLMMASSKTAKDFSLAQIKNLVHRATLTNRYHTTLKDTKNSKVPFTRRVEGQRQRDFILTKDEDDTRKVGWDMKARVDESKAVVDLSGLQGFTVRPMDNEISGGGDRLFTDFELERAIEASKTATADISGDSADISGDSMYVEDEVSDEAIWNKIIELEQKKSLDESSRAINASISEAASNGLSSIETVSLSEDNSVLAKEKKGSNRVVQNQLDEYSFDVIYPDIANQLANLKSVEEIDAEIALVEKRIGKAHKDSLIYIHQHYMKLILEMKNDFQQPHIASLLDRSASSTPIHTATAAIRNLHSSPIGVGKQKPPLSFEDDEPAELIEIDSDGDAPIQTSNVSLSPVTVNTLNHISKPAIEVIEIFSDEGEIEWETIDNDIPRKNDVLDIEKSSSSNSILVSEQDNITTSVPTLNEVDMSVSDEAEEPEDESEEIQEVLGVDNLGENEALGFLDELQNDAPTTVLSDQERQDAIKNTSQEISGLRQLQKLEMKNVGEVSNAMIEETQDLLRLFGIPFLNAPMEAESQCAYLVQNKLVDGIITDDSDVFLFGGDMVYKNLFDSKKYIEKFSMENLDAKMKLKRHHLIQMAYLLGSDYTPGLKGIGPVAAIEIVTSWPSTDLSGLKSFKTWVLNLQSGFNDPDDTPTQKKLRKICKKIEISEAFPNPSVFESYTEPVVITEVLEFVFKEPDLERISSYLKRKLGWSVSKIEQKIIPVLQELHSRKSKARQTNVDSFFTRMNNNTPKVIKSKRILKATGIAIEVVRPTKSTTGKRGRGRKAKSNFDVQDFL